MKILNFLKRFFIINIKLIFRKIEFFTGYKIQEIFDSLSLAAFCLILIKFLFLFTVNNVIPPFISYSILFNFTLTFLILDLYYNYRESILIPFFKYGLGEHYYLHSFDHIYDNDERIRNNFSYTFGGTCHYYIKWLFYPFFRNLYNFLIFIRLIIIKNYIKSNFFIFFIFQILIFNQFLLVSLGLSLILNLSRNIFISSDLNIKNLQKEINNLYGDIINYKNYKFISFWVLRTFENRITFILEYTTKKNIQLYNLLESKPFMETKINKHNLNYVYNKQKTSNFLQKRFFTKINIANSINNKNLTIIFLSESFLNNLSKQYCIPINILLDTFKGSLNHYHHVEVTKKTITFRAFQTKHNDNQKLPLMRSPKEICYNETRQKISVFHEVGITFDYNETINQEITFLSDTLINNNKYPISQDLLKEPCKQNILNIVNLQKQIYIHQIFQLYHSNINDYKYFKYAISSLEPFPYKSFENKIITFNEKFYYKKSNNVITYDDVDD